MRRFGWKNAVKLDARDYKYRAYHEALLEIPPVKYLICPPVADQEDLGSCVFFALSYALEMAQFGQVRVPMNPSQLWAYWNYRRQFGDVARDDGAYIRNAIKSIVADGMPLEECWPYITGNFAKTPPAECASTAKENRISEYFSLDTLDEMLHCIASGFGFVCGISVYESFDSLTTERTGIVAMPAVHTEKFLGGHAIYVGGGYDQHKQAFKFQNSWGPEWGDKGFGWIPFEYLASNGLCGDRWTIRK
jgi:C1A family cysteine protease